MKILEKKDNKPCINSIGEGTVLNGEINSGGDIRVDGTLKGSVKVEGKLVLGPSGKIEGDVECGHAIIAGELKAKITSKNLLTLKSSAKLYGDIFAGKLEIEPGAVFTGSCSMGPIIKELQSTEKNKAPQKDTFSQNNEKTA
jgi:cytoskeletal protein CcmA (bactofilin family)